MSVLFGVEPADLLHHPLGGFQFARAEKAEILKVLRAINERLGDAALGTAHLELVFEKWWGDFQSEIAAWSDPVADVPVGHTGDQRTPDAVERIHAQLGDLIQLNQELSRALATPERLLPAGYLRSVLAEQGRHRGRYREPLSRIAMRIEDLSSYLEDVRISDQAQWRYFQKMLFSLERDVERLADALEIPMKLHGRGKRFLESRGFPNKRAQLDKPKGTSASSVSVPTDPGTGANGIHGDSGTGTIVTDTASA